MPGVVAYQGEPGAYSDEAAQALFPGARTEGYPSFAAVFEALQRKAAELAVLPVENSVAGVVQEVSDGLWDHPSLWVCGEHVAPIRHHLLARPGARVRHALSHPQALAQCAGWLAAQGISAVPVHDTAGAARQVAESGGEADGAIASLAAARRYGLEVLASDIADQPSNRTRFLLVSPGPREAPSEGPCKLVLALVAEHRPGGLVRVLQVFSRRGANLSRLDSRPEPSRPFSYRFYIDAELDDAHVVPELDRELRSTAGELRVFGVFAS